MLRILLGSWNRFLDKIVARGAGGRYPNDGRGPFSRSDLWVALLLIAVTLTIYSNSLHNDFVFDDISNIVNNPLLTNLRNVPAILGLGTGKPLYRPIRHLSYALDFFFSGLNPVAYHISNIIYHAVASFLVFLIVAALTKDRRTALMAGLLFAVHPVQTDSVTYLSGRRDILCGLFFFAGFYAYVRYRQTGRRGYLGGALIAYILSIFSKEMGVTLPVMFFLYDCFAPLEPQTDFHRLRLAAITAIRKARYVYGALAVGMIAFLYYKIVIHNPSHATGYYGGSFINTMLTVARVHLHYLKLLVFPLVLNADYSYNAFPVTTSVADPAALLAVLALLVVAYLLVASLKVHKQIAFCGLWYFISLLPVSQIVPHHELLAEHYLYIPLFAFSFLVSLLFTAIMDQYTRSWPIVTAFVIVVTLFGARTWARNRDWKDSLTLWKKTVQTAPQCARAHSNLCGALTSIGRLDEAVEECRQALSIKPDASYAYCNLGKAYEAMGRYQEAAKQYRKALQFDPHLALAHFRLGLYLAKHGHLSEAISEFKKSLEREPGWALTHLDLAIAYSKLRDKKKALLHFRKAVELAPKSSIAQRSRFMMRRLESQ